MGKKRSRMATVRARITVKLDGVYHIPGQPSQIFEIERKRMKGYAPGVLEELTVEVEAETEPSEE